MTIIFASIIAYLIIAFLLNNYSKKRQLSEEWIPDSKDTEEDKESNEEEIAEVEVESNTENIEAEESKIEISEKNKISCKNNEIEDPELISFAKTAKTVTEVKFVLEQNNSAIIQMTLARTKLFEVQEYLLQYPALRGCALVEICEKPANFNFDNPLVKEDFNKAMERAKLQPEQEVRIAKCQSYTIKLALLRRSKLTGEGLVAFCENTGEVNLESETVRRWLDKAVKRTKLTTQQEVRIAQTGFFEMQRALMLMKADLSYEGFLEICRNPKELRMSSITVQEWFKNVTKKLAPTLSSDQKVKLAKTKIEGVLEGLTE